MQALVNRTSELEDRARELGRLVAVEEEQVACLRRSLADVCCEFYVLILS